MSWVTILVLAILIGCAFWGMKKGVIRIVLSLVSLIVTAILVCMLTPVVTSALQEHTTLYDSVYTAVDDYFEEKGVFNLPDSSQVIEELPVPAVIRTAIEEHNTLDQYAELGVSSFRAYVTTYVANVIFNAIVFVITFIIVFVIVKVLTGALNLIGKLPVIKEANKLAGLAVGFLEGLVIVWVFLAFATMLAGTGFGSEVLASINDSFLLSLLYNTDPLMKYLTAIV